jgi:hypothetical protein
MVGNTVMDKFSDGVGAFRGAAAKFSAAVMS